MKRRKPSSNPREAALTLALLVDTLAAEGVTAWLTDGTLLGAVRERKFIEHDLDMDVGAMITEYRPAILTALEAAGFTIPQRYGKREQGLEHWLERNGFSIDIFWHYDTPNGGVQHSAYDEPYDESGRVEYHYDQLTLAPITFYGREYWAPNPPRLHLVQKYGLDWRTPKTEWDYADDPVNARRPA